MRSKFHLLMIFGLSMLIGLVVNIETTSGVDSNTKSWKDETTGLTWQVSPNGGKTVFSKASEHCENLTLDGRQDWRLPTISELRSLIRGCPATQKDGSCKVTDACLSWECFSEEFKSCQMACQSAGGPGSDGAFWPPEIMGDVGWYWSASKAKDSIGYWGVEFSSGQVRNGPQIRDTPDDIRSMRCVRP